VFEASRVVAMGSFADAELGDLSAKLFTAALPVLRGKKKPSLGVVQ